MKYHKHCSYCGSEELNFDSISHFNSSSGSFEIGAVFHDKPFCVDCDANTQTKGIDNEEDYFKALTAHFITSIMRLCKLMN